MASDATCDRCVSTLSFDKFSEHGVQNVIFNEIRSLSRPLQFPLITNLNVLWNALNL
jgi:hypothetical protein